ncbi:MULTISPECIES: nucleotidyltransferase family protein [unclassified Roseovarius]|uniref:nucleotidyltransferase family protein n=1 Tax=unclassified Roseovarius TaxID=2614913 RepID=UPI00273F035F|nr:MULTISPECIES: nucleotidyltransferase family protein [unclassified Roseovarius]
MLIVIPAAGASSRMRGRDKLLECVRNQPLLARQVSVALATGMDVLVTLPPDNPDRQAIVEGMAAQKLHLMVVDHAEEGLSASLRGAVTFARNHDADSMMILLADLPEIETADLTTMIRQFDGKTILRASDSDGRAGHPVIFPGRYFGALRGLAGDQGARVIMMGEDVMTIPLPDRRATTDLDTPEDWTEWRERTGCLD